MRDRVHFWVYLLNCNPLIHQTWSVDRYKQGQYFSEIFWMTWRTGTKYQALSYLANCSNYSITNLVKFPVFHVFWKGEWRRIKNSKYQLLKIDRSRYIIISSKSSKHLELVPSLQHWTKNKLEMSVIRYTSIWPNFTLTVLKIQKKSAKV